MLIFFLQLNCSATALEKYTDTLELNNTQLLQRALQQHLIKITAKHTFHIKLFFFLPLSIDINKV